MRWVCGLMAIFVLCAGLLACGGSGKRRSSVASAGSASTQAAAGPPKRQVFMSSAEKGTAVVAPSTHVKFAMSLPQSDGDADNPKDFDGTPDPDYHADSDRDTFTRASYRYPDGDEQWSFGYGRAATPSERRLLAGLLTRYYSAARAGDTSTACAILLPSVARTVTPSLEEHSGRRPGETCEGALTSVFERMAYTLSGTIAITHVRVDGRRAEVVFGSKTMFASYVFFRRYGHTWKLEEAMPAQLP